MLSIWENMDTYLHNVDKALCSNDCPCSINGGISFSEDPEYGDEYKKWVTTNVSYGAVSFKQCSRAVKQEVYDVTKKDNSNFDTDGSFNMEEFAEYMGRIEERFKCVGWCNTKYPSTNNTNNETESNINDNDNDNVTEVNMIKYLFSNVNKGPVKNRGCMQPLLKYVSDLLISFGSLSLFASILQLVLLTFGVSMFKLLSFMENPPAGQPSQSEQMGIIGGDEQKNLKVNEEERNKNQAEEVIRDNNNLRQREENN